MRVFKTILTATVAIALLAVGAVGIGSMFSGQGFRLYSVQSGSMEPVLSRGDLVIVHRVPATQYQVGDVITFMNPLNRNQTVTHRIVQITEGTRRVFRTKGDVNQIADQPFNETLAVGKQVAHVPYVGYGLDALRTIPGLIVMIYIPALIIMISETRRLKRYYDAQTYRYYPHQSSVFRFDG